MKIDIKVGLSQNIKLNRKILQALKILQQSQLELQQTVQQALESNIMLEEDQPGNEAEADANADGNNEQAPATSEERIGEGSEEQSPNEELPGEQAEGQIMAEDIPEQLPIDTAWEDIASSDIASAATRSESSASGVDAASLHVPEKSLHDYLQEQIQYLDLDDLQQSIAMAIIDAVDNKGYLGESLQALSAMFSGIASMEQMQGVLQKIQKLDPPGVAARTPQECLKIQLSQLLVEQRENQDCINDAMQIVDQAMQALANGQVAKIQGYFRWSEERVNKAIGLIRQLKPHPGADYENSPTRHIVPEVYVRRKDNQWKVELSQEQIPRLRINPHYMGFITRGKRDSDQSSLKSHLQEARWLIENLQSRAEVMLKVSSYIVRHQENFLKFGEEALRPLTLEDVAKEVGVHLSTVSRATIGKYIYTPQGVFPFRFFFPSQLRTEYSDGTSSTAVKALIKKLLSGEDPGKPLSDNSIADTLEKRGIKIARRTVAKYREAMNIPARKDRRRKNIQ